MSTILQALAISCEKRKGTDKTPEELRSRYGIVAAFSAAAVLSDLVKLDGQHEFIRTSAQKGVDLAFAAYDVLTESKQPETINIVNDSEKKVIVKPITFQVGGAGLAGFMYGFDKFVRNKDDIEVTDISYGEIQEIEEPTVLAKFFANGRTNDLIAMNLQSLNEIFPQNEEPSFTIAFLPKFDGSYFLDLAVPAPGVSPISLAPVV